MQCGQGTLQNSTETAPRRSLAVQVVTLVESARQQPLSFASCIDPRAGPWPAAEAQAFADLALRCVALRRQDRPDLR